MDWINKHIATLVGVISMAAVLAYAPIKAFPQILAPIFFANTVATPPLSGMLVWWSADVGSNCSGACTDGASQSSWADQSGNGNTGTLTPALTANCVASVYHTNQINGKPAVTFNGNTTVGSETCFSVGNSGTGLDNKSTTTIFAVEKFAAGPGVELVIAGGSMNSFRWEGNGIGGGSSLQGAFQGSTANIGFGTATNNTNWNQINVTYNSSSGAFAFRVNRAADGSGTNAKSITSNWLCLGITIAGGSLNTMNGQIAEFILYNRVLSGTEITTVETYLNAKYGL